MKRDRQTELLAPAGNPAAFYGAVNAGADAVYLGGSRFGARAYAENFTEDEILRCIRYGHLFGKKIYLTINTLMREKELQELTDWLLPFCREGLDAVIVQDFGALRRIRECFPEVAVHASTQMTLCSRFGAELLKEMGASRIVPARELSLEELKNIRSSVDIELETFVHGAMCYCYSGQCLFSSILGGRSGNRGRCAQPCRLPYRAGTREGYYLSLKDMCTVDHLPELIEAGIDSFKIEGRMKRPEYTAGVTAVYRKYMDQYLELSERFGREEGAERFRVEREDRRKLNSLYIRSEVQDGYYFKRNGAEMVTLTDPSYGKNDEELLEGIRRKYLSEPKRLPLFMKAVFQTGEPACLTLTCGDSRTEVLGDTVEAALRQPVTEENIRRQLGKLGDSVFFLQGLEVSLSRDSFYSLKQLNELRRESIRCLEEKLLQSRGYGDGAVFSGRGGEASRKNFVFSHLEGEPWQNGNFTVLAEKQEQLRALAGWLEEHPDRKLSCIHVSGDLLEREEEETLRLCGRLAEDCPVLIALPYVLRETERGYLDKLWSLAGEGRPFSGFLVRSADGLGYLRRRREEAGLRRKPGRLLYLDANVYTWNSQAVKELWEAGADCFCLPLELNAGEQRRLLERTGAAFEKLVYGRIPMMITANCLLRTQGKCRKDDRIGGETVLTDRYGKNFPVAVNCRHCMNIIYNSLPLSLHGECAGWISRAGLRIHFTIEPENEVRRILDAFPGGKELVLEGHTTGHEKRGAE